MPAPDAATLARWREDIRFEDTLRGQSLKFSTTWGIFSPEAIDRLRGSAFARNWLGDRFVDAFSATRQSQYDQFRKKVPDVELQRFFDLG